MSGQLATSEREIAETTTESTIRAFRLDKEREWWEKMSMKSERLETTQKGISEGMFTAKVTTERQGH